MEEAFKPDHADTQRGKKMRREAEELEFEGLDDDKDCSNPSKEGKKKAEKSGVARGVIRNLRQSLEDAEDKLEDCKTELEAVKIECKKWHSAFPSSPVTPAGTNPEPVLVMTYIQNLKSSEGSIKKQLEKAKKKEAVYGVNLAKQEQEIANLKSAVGDLKKQLRPPSMQMRKLFLDPAIHEEFTHLKNLAEEKDKKIKELQDNIAAANFTKFNIQGKMLMAKCRTLKEENEELGARTSEGRLHELEMKIAVLKSQNTELRNQFDVLYQHMEGLTNDVETSNETVSILQKKLQTKDDELRKLKDMLAKKETVAEMEKVAGMETGEEQDLDVDITQ